MNRRDSMKIVATTLAGATLTTNSTAAWTPKSSFLPPVANEGSRKERYAKYEQLVAEKQFDLLSDEQILKFAAKVNPIVDGKRHLGDHFCAAVLVNAAVYGDVFLESPDGRSIFIHRPGTMFRIETVKGKLIEFQQGNDGVDYGVFGKPFSETEKTGTNIRFHPEQIVHIRPNCYKYAPYGTSLMESGELLFHPEMLRYIRNELAESQKLLKV